MPGTVRRLGLGILPEWAPRPNRIEAVLHLYGSTLEEVTTPYSDSNTPNVSSWKQVGRTYPGLIHPPESFYAS